MAELNNGTSIGLKNANKFSWLQVVGIVLVTILITIGITFWAAKTYIFPSQFKPVTLTAQEEQLLSVKLDSLDFPQKKSSSQDHGEKDKEDLNAPLKPEAYSEKGASREISFTERELNAMLASNTDLATMVAVDLADDLISARLRIPMDQDFPIFGGKTLRAAAGVELAYRDGRPVVILKGVKLMGVPIPNAWLGGLKNIDLVREFGGDEGFWKLFSDGVESIATQDGLLNITLQRVVMFRASCLPGERG